MTSSTVCVREGGWEGEQEGGREREKEKERERERKREKERERERKRERENGEYCKRWSACHTICLSALPYYLSDHRSGVGFRVLFGGCRVRGS